MIPTRLLVDWPLGRRGYPGESRPHECLIHLECIKRHIRRLSPIE